MAFRRRKFLVDRKVQGAILARAATYWCYCLLAVATTMCGVVLLSFQPMTSGEMFSRLWVQCGPALLATLLLIPFVLYDCARLSNRFAGPLYRLRGAMQQIVNGERIGPVKVRDDDFCQEFVDDFNLAIAKLQSQADANQTVGADAVPDELDDSSEPVTTPIVVTDSPIPSGTALVS